MSEESFKEHVEALATKRLEKPKKLSARNGRYWSEILSQHYNFHRDTLEVRAGFSYNCSLTTFHRDILEALLTTNIVVG
jgi:secreted Zn-dependent insulinase-like peptidase